MGEWQDEGEGWGLCLMPAEVGAGLGLATPGLVPHRASGAPDSGQEEARQ